MTTAADDVHARWFTGKNVLVTGGLGFIGSNLAHRLVTLGARVTLLDSLLPDYGGNRFNVAGLEKHLEIVVVDVRDRDAMDHYVRGRDVIFNLAGQVSHIDSMVDPITDLDINCRAQLSLLESCRARNRDVKVVFAGSRQQYGRPEYLPVDERHPIHPVDVNGINKVAGEQYHVLYSRVYGIRAVSLRLTNTYGPRQLVRHNRQGFIAWFVRKVVEGATIDVFGDGSQLRDLNFVDDVVDAFLRAAASERSNGEIYNLAGDDPIALKDLAALLVELAGAGAMRLVAWPPEKKRIDIGSIYGTYAKIHEHLGWRPTTPLREGLSRTIAYYREHLARYV